MLQPIKSTTSTAATQATEASDAVRPISEQRPGTTLRDRLFEGPEIRGGKKSATPTGNAPSLFQQYSIAKSLPTTPLTATTTTTAPGTFSSFVNKFTNYNDFWQGLSAYQKPESKKEFISDKYGTAFISPELMPYADKYGLSKGEGFLKDLYRADRVADARKGNPYWQPIMLKDMKEYFDGNEALSFTRAEKTSETGRKYSGLLGGQNIKLDEKEIGTLRKVAEDNMLGQAGFEELLDRAHKKKVTSAMEGVTPSVVQAIQSPEKADWGKLSQDLSFQVDFKLSNIDGLVEGLTKGLSNPFSGGLGGVAQQFAGWGGDKLGLGVPGGGVEDFWGFEEGTSIGGGAGSWVGPIATVAGMLGSLMEQKKLAKWENANFSPIKNGRLATSIDQYSGSEKNNIKEIADAAGLTADQLVKVFAGMQVAALSATASRMGSVYDKYSGQSDSDRALSFNDTGIGVSSTYNPYGGK